MTWEYFRISGFDSYVERKVTAVYKVKTEFMFFLDDEECILWTGVKRAIERFPVSMMTKKVTLYQT